MIDLIGKLAPDFALPDQDGKMHALSDYRGQKVLVYFYPKDMTPGCTIEAKCFRDRMNDLKAVGVQVLGISADSVESHKKFVKKHHLNFPLLADMKKEVIEAYGVFKEKSMFGKTFMGIRRDSFLVDEKGVVVRHYEKVKPKEHADEVLEKVRSMS